MSTRLILSAVSILGWWLLNTINEAVRSSYQASLAVGQLSDSAINYGLSRWLATNNLVGPALFAILFVVLVVIWLPYLRRQRAINMSAAAMLLGFITLATSACVGPAKVEPIEEIGPSETAFLVPLEGQTASQGKFMSVEYLNANKVAAKRVTIPVRDRSIGRAPWSYEYIPTMRLIKVDRKPVVREWTQDPKKGTGPKDEAIGVETKESIGISIGFVAGARVLEDDAAIFLYNFAGVPLETIMDQNVRGFIQKKMFDAIGAKTLDQTRDTKAEFIGQVEIEARTAFKPLGVTIDYIGGSDGLLYDNPAIQTGIDDTFRAQQLVLSAQAKATQQAVDNNRELVMTGNEAAKKATQAAGDAAAIQQTGEMLARYPGYLQLRQLEVNQSTVNKWSGNYPTVLGGSGGDLATIINMSAAVATPQAK